MVADGTWPSRPLKDCAVWYSGGTPNKGTVAYWGGPIPWISAKSLTRFIADSNDRVTEEGARTGTRLVPTDSILFVVRGMSLKSEFRVGIAMRQVTFNQDLKALVAVDDVLPRYLLYAIESRTPEILSMVVEAGHGTGVLPTDRIQGLAIPVPPHSEQLAIASVIGALDDKIELGRRTSETLEQIARVLFKSWFVDFDPVRAKAAAHTPAFMDAATADSFPGAFDAEVPRGWTRAPLGAWVDVLSGGTPAKGDASLWNGDVPWISPKVMTTLHADRADAFVTTAAIGNGTRLAPRGSTLVMVRGMGLHVKVRVSQARREVTFNQDVKALVPRGIEPDLLLFALLDGQEDLLGKVEAAGNGTGKLPTEILLAHPLTFPPAAVQAKLAPTFTALNDRIAIIREETRTLAEVRDLLLPRLLSGELRVRDAERAVEKVA